MLNNNVLDVCIGLVFIYLIYSLLATILQEIIATNLGFRAKLLQKAITRMLGDENDADKHAFMDRLDSFDKLIIGKKIKPDTLTNNFYCHPLIRFLAEDKWHSKPSYISKENFSTVMIDLLRGESFNPGANYILTVQKNLKSGVIKKEKIQNKKNISYTMDIQPEALTYLRALYLTSQGDIHKFQDYLEAWFQNTMERTTGWYKRYTQVILFIVGLILAGIFNIDTIALTQKLSRDPKLRERLVNSAAVYIDHQRNSPAVPADTQQRKIAAATAKSTEYLVNKGTELFQQEVGDANQAIAMDKLGPYFIPGWLITALAISLGAPFWFDLLNKFMSLRAAKQQSAKENKRTTDQKVVG